MAIVDGGYKAFSTDRPFTPQPVGIDGVTYGWAGDEHGRLDVTNASRDLKVGDRLEFIPPHIDPTVNLYDPHLRPARRPCRSGLAHRRSGQVPVATDRRSTD